MSECSICCETFNKSSRSMINCQTCDSDIKVCQVCAKRYILDKPTDASCMVCKVEWDQEFLSNNFTKKFVFKELKEHRERYLLERQLAQLPETQEYAEQLKLINGLEKQIEIINKKKRELEKQVKEYNLNVRGIYQTIYEIKNVPSTQRNKREFVNKCPVDNCNGFLNDKFECGICENKICKHCMEIKNDNHECNEDKKKTVQLIRQDTKPCPKCGQLIHKLPNGCDQMYCIKCHTAFSWRTGQLERGTIHNPEYYRWMRENGREIPRNPADIRYDPCGNQVMDYTSLLRILRTYFKPEKPEPLNITATGRRTYAGMPIGRGSLKDCPETIKIANMHRMIGHIDYLNRNFTNEINNNETILRNYRADYILNKITKDEFKKKLQMLEKKQNKSKKINDIWNLLRVVLVEYIGKITEREYTVDEGCLTIRTIINDSEKIRKYCIKSFCKIGKMFAMSYPGINLEWIQIYNWEKYVNETYKTNEMISNNSVLLG